MTVEPRYRLSAFDTLVRHSIALIAVVGNGRRLDTDREIAGEDAGDDVGRVL